MNRLNWEDKQSRRNREAEDSAAREKAWGSGVSGEEDMGDTTYLGDITEQHYHTPSATGNIAKTLAAAGLLAAGLGAAAAVPIAAYNLTKGEAAEPAPVAGADSDTQYGLRVFRPIDGE